MDPTLPQRLHLVSYDIERSRLDPVSAAYRGHLLRAAALTEMIISGLLRGHGGRVERDLTRLPEDPFLAEVLVGLSPKEPSHWINAVQDRTYTAEAIVQDQLVANGAVRVDRGRMLGVFPTRKVTLNRPEEVRLLRDRTREVVLAGYDPQTAPVEDVALAAIAVEGDVWTVFTPKERQKHKAEFKALQKHFDAQVPGMRNAILTAVVNRRSGSA